MTGRPEVQEEFLALARWRSRRGMLELDFFLVGFAEQVLPGLSASEQDSYFRLLACEDMEIHAWLTGGAVPEDAALAAIVEQIRRHAAQPRS